MHCKPHFCPPHQSESCDPAVAREPHGVSIYRINSRPSVEPSFTGSYVERRKSLTVSIPGAGTPFQRQSLTVATSGIGSPFSRQSSFACRYIHFCFFEQRKQRSSERVRSAFGLTFRRRAGIYLVAV